MRQQDQHQIRRGPASGDAAPAPDSEELQQRVWEARLGDQASPDFGAHQVTATSGGWDAQEQPGARELPRDASSVLDVSRHGEAEDDGSR